ncbi:MAG: DoxX family protein [Flavobacterium sp.]
MKKLLLTMLCVRNSRPSFDIAMLFFRTAISIEIIIVHGFKKLGIGVAVAEQIPNPLSLPETFNTVFALGANLFFPVLIIFGFLTRIMVLPVLAVTLTGYFILHRNDPGLVKDIPFMYSTAYLLIMVLGPGKYSLDFLIRKQLLSHIQS